MAPWIAIAVALVAFSFPRPAAGDEIAKVEARIAQFNEMNPVPLPALAPEDLEKLRAREVVKQKHKLPLPDAVEEGEEADMKVRGIAYRIVDAPLLDTWLAVLDPHTLFPGRVKEYRLVDHGRGNMQMYQHISLPWPVRDRNWVIDTWLDEEIARRTDGEIWQQAWQLSRSGRDEAFAAVRAGKVAGLNEDSAEKAVYLPANVGSWVLAEIDSARTFVAYQLTVVLGGWIPEGLGMKLAMRELDETLNKVAGAAAGMREHYVGAHPVLYRGDRSAARRFDEPPPPPPERAPSLRAAPRDSLTGVPSYSLPDSGSTSAGDSTDSVAAAGTDSTGAAPPRPE